MYYIMVSGMPSKHSLILVKEIQSIKFWLRLFKIARLLKAHIDARHRDVGIGSRALRPVRRPVL